VIAREGYALIAGAALLGALLLALAWRLDAVWARALLVVAAVGVVGFTVYFFRDPARTAPPDADRLLLAPADGVVVEIADEPAATYLDGPARRLSIFLSPLNVHVNRVPASGTVEYVRYVPGDYLVAWHPKASEKNERSEIGVRHPSGTKVLFKQIAGAVARRIVFYLDEGDRVQAGARFGIVKFGSRMDVIVPPSVSFDAAEGDRVRAGETVLARLPAPAANTSATDAATDASSVADAPRPAAAP
jgi:phosphatidylserine decarboxylase